MNLPLSIFGEAVLTAVYIINCCANKASAEMAPEEAFTGHLTYMCLDLMHLFKFPILHRLSLGPRARNTSFSCITAILRHIDYWILKLGIVISRDVHFLESQSNNSRITPDLISEVQLQLPHLLFDYYFNY